MVGDRKSKEVWIGVQMLNGGSERILHQVEADSKPSCGKGRSSIFNCWIHSLDSYSNLAFTLTIQWFFFFPFFKLSKNIIHIIQNIKLFIKLPWANFTFVMANNSKCDLLLRSVESHCLAVSLEDSTPSIRALVSTKSIFWIQLHFFILALNRLN